MQRNLGRAGASKEYQSRNETPAAPSKQNLDSHTWEIFSVAMAYIKFQTLSIEFNLGENIQR